MLTAGVKSAKKVSVDVADTEPVGLTWSEIVYVDPAESVDVEAVK
jgi:hypothetical protein